jgi:asparagine synthase (glutamine-hydrolysing)
MCGICGFLNIDGSPAQQSVIERMNETLIHRGPDDRGIFLKGPVALGHRRLSIIDLARGHQPMALPGEPYQIVYNGEIYNHAKIRQQLPFPTDQYRTNCDTETILAAYHTQGIALLSGLRGMFAFAIYDERANSLLLARDRLGIKPLYYYQSPTLFAFASEIKSLLAHPEISADFNVDQLPLLLSLKYSLDEQTFFRGILKLLPGHAMRVAAEGAHIFKYWDVCFEPKSHFESIDDAADAFREKFVDSVETRLMADVPLGVFLSGGIDSSAIASVMSKLVDDPIKAFSVSFEVDGYSELSFSRMVANSVGADVREVVIAPQNWWEAWPKLVYHEDEPIAHPASIPLYYVSALAATEVKVVLTGEGADELMAGYERYLQTLWNLELSKYVPSGVRTAARRILDMLPERFPFKRKAVRTSLYLSSDIDSIFLDNYAAFSRAGLMRILREEHRTSSLGSIYAQFSRLMALSGAEHLLDQLLYADIKTYLVELLMKQDQMSMSASIESRVPFLDHHLVEFICALPVEFKLKGFVTKRILRLALADMIPQQILTRSKKGFPTPTKEWFRGEFYGSMQRLLLSKDSLITEYLIPEQIRCILDRHRAGKANLQDQIWIMGNLELWLRIFMDGQKPEDITAQFAGDSHVPLVA